MTRVPLQLELQFQKKKAIRSPSPLSLPGAGSPRTRLRGDPLPPAAWVGVPAHSVLPAPPRPALYPWPRGDGNIPSLPELGQEPEGQDWSAPSACRTSSPGSCWVTSSHHAPSGEQPAGNVTSCQVSATRQPSSLASLEVSLPTIPWLWTVKKTTKTNFISVHTQDFI